MKYFIILMLVTGSVFAAPYGDYKSPYSKSGQSDLDNKYGTNRNSELRQEEERRRQYTYEMNEEAKVREARRARDSAQMVRDAERAARARENDCVYGERCY